MLIEQTDVETAEFLEEAQLDSDPQPADNWADGDINTPEAGSFGALGAELEKLVDWVDEVDPLTGEVTRRPVLKTSGENAPGEAETDAPQAGPVQTGPDPAGVLMEE
jgi:hypothetical protein